MDDVAGHIVRIYFSPSAEIWTEGSMHAKFGFRDKVTHPQSEELNSFIQTKNLYSLNTNMVNLSNWNLLFYCIYDLD